MGAAEQSPRVTFEEFLSLKPLNTTKHEWLNGLVYMMAGGTFEHGRLVDNMLVALRQRLEGRPCRPFSGNFLVRTSSGLGAYPEYVLVRQSRPSLEVFSRRDGWAPRIAFAGEAIDLWSIDVTLNVDEFY